MTERERKPRGAQPTPEVPHEGADLEPQSQPLSHHEPPGAHADEPHAADAHRADAHAAAAHGADAHGAGAHGAGAHASDAHDSDAHATDAHGSDAHGHHDEPRLGPIDWSAWAYAVAGAVIALVLLGAFWVAAY